MAGYRDRLSGIAAIDVEVLEAKDREYGGSWLKRGGVGAFMMLSRKWDRIEERVQKVLVQPPGGENQGEVAVDKWDIIQHALFDDRPEGLLDDLGDLRRYLLLVEAEIRTRMAGGEYDGQGRS